MSGVKRTDILDKPSFSHTEYELCPSLTLAVIVTGHRELATKINHCIFIEADSQFKFNGHPSLTVSQAPDTFAQDSINHRPDFVLLPPDCIEVSHKTQSSVPRSH